MKGPERIEAQLGDVALLSRARSAAAQRAVELGRAELSSDAALVVSELVTNALLHAGGCTGIAVIEITGGVRVEVRDGSHLPPMFGRPSEDTLTGRGLRLVAAVASRWGADDNGEGKVVWAELTPEGGHTPGAAPGEDLLAIWGDDLDEPAAGRFHVELGDVPTDLLLSAKAHVDNVARELTLAAAGAHSGVTGEVPPHLASLISAVVERFADARLAIKRQALAAARRGEPSTCLALDLPASAADAAEDYIRALDEVDAYCRARRLLTLETPPQHRLFRHWYVEELVKQLRAASKGEATPPAQPFVRRLLAELDRVAIAQGVTERAARLYSLAAALATAATPEAVAEAVINEGVVALGASGGGVLLTSAADRLLLPGAVGYDEDVIARLRNESPDAELPAAVALRTGQAVWLESRDERDARFPELAGMEANTVSLCAVPLEVKGKRLGALRFSFEVARLFDEDERRFVLALAAQTAQALDRAQLQLERIDVSRRLQRSLLPPSIPPIAGLEVAAIYHPFGDGIDVGGDFYDVWQIDSHCWALAIGDAAGTGPEAAALTALVRHTLRALTLSESDPAEVTRTLNMALLDAAPDEDTERFCTLLFGIITTKDGVELQLASGGHPAPVIRRADGTIQSVELRGSLLGLFRSVDVDTAKVRLDPGDTLVLVTDGVLEARRDGAFFDAAGVDAVLAGEDGSARHVAESIEQAVLRHTGGSLTDDMASVVLRVPD